MATFYGDNNALVFDALGNATGTQLSPRSGYGNVRAVSDTFSIVSGSGVDVAFNDTVRMGGAKIPKGALLVDATLTVHTAFTSAAASVSAGDDDDDDRFLQAIDVTTPGVYRTARAVGIGHIYENDVFISLINKAANLTDASTGSLTLVVQYATP